MKQTGEIKGYKNAFWSGVTTNILVNAIEWAINNNISGIYNITNGKKICKYDLLNLLKKHTNKKIDIKPDEIVKTDKGFVDTRKLINFKIPSYNKMIKDMIIDIKNNRNLYQKFYISMNRVLIVSHYFWPENFKINSICQELVKKGYEISVLTGKPNYPVGSFKKGYTFFNKNYEIWNKN